ncbi:proline-rich protein 36-like [Vitis riparia]|uniref:proline-rich protein 36-like n=1 Tax=Vitis riparia TaxID=96939 RepID=UPI00155AEA05|nr:proline-rich protein 36-like [Vitis riparia]
MEIIPPAPAAPSIVPTPEATSSAPPTTLGTPPVVLATLAPPPSESTITISASKFRGLCHTLQTLTTTQSILAQQMAIIRAHQDQLIAMQTQHTAILRQIQQYLGILMPPEHDMLGPSKPTDPSQEAPPTEQTMPHEETTTVEIETPIQSTQTTTTEPSSPHDPPTTT